MSDIKINEVELTKINLQEGDILAVKLIGDTMDSSIMNNLKVHLEKVFTKNKVLVFAMPENNDILFEAIKQSPAASYCSGCNCGKKEVQNG